MYIREEDYPFKTKPLFSRWGRISESKFAKKFQISFVEDNKLGDPSGFKPKVIHYEIFITVYLVDILFFDTIFLETNNAQGTIFKRKRETIIGDLSMDVDQEQDHIKNFCGLVQWYMMSSHDFVSDISFKLKNEHGESVSFSGKFLIFIVRWKELKVF